MKTTLVVADDHHLVRAGLCALLSAQKDFKIVAEAGDGLETLRCLERQPPDVLLLDLMLPGLNGLDIVRYVAKTYPRVRIVVVTMHANEAYIVEAFRHGASAYVLKDSTAGNLVHAVREVTAGRRFLSPPLTEESLDAYRQRAAKGCPDLYESLTLREREVLQLVAEGRTNARIAHLLSISRRTVEVHRARVMRKLGARTTADVVRFAMERRLIATHGPSDSAFRDGPSPPPAPS